MHGQLVRAEETGIACNLSDLGPIEIILVNQTPYEVLWDQLVKQYHYLGYQKMYGPRIKYLAKVQSRIIAAISFNRAALKVGTRDCYIGWEEPLKRKHLHRVVCNNRFLILPWVHVKNLASHLLSRTLRLLRNDWLLLYGVSPFLVETFVDSARYQGTCYKAAGWQELGETRGYAKNGKTYVYHGNKKSVFVKVLDKRFRKQLGVKRRPLPIKKKSGRECTMILSKPGYDPNILKTCGLDQADIVTVSTMLDVYLKKYQPCYKRSDQKRWTDTFIKGLLSDLDRKSIEPVALRYSGPKGVRCMQMFFKNATFDDAKMLEIYQQQMSSLIGEASGMLNVDGSDFPKKGINSVGVARQHCGILGKTENCQAGVFLGYSSTKGYGLLDRRLYIPQKWFSDEYAKLCNECAVPEDLAFHTKIQLASMMLHQVIASEKFPFTWVGCDSFFGCDRAFLESLPKDCYYFADVRAKTLVFPEMPEMILPPSKSTGRKPTHAKPSLSPVSVETYAADETIPWQRIILAEGAKGPIIADIKCIRCICCASSTQYRNYVIPKEPVWLYIRRYANGRIKYSLSNAPEDTPMETLNRVATMRWPIEQCFEECKSHLGMGHYETRSYQAWNRHMLFVMMAHLFTLILRLHFKKNGHFDHAHGQENHCCVSEGG